MENEWHWSRDVPLGEEDHRYANRTSAAVFFLLRTVAMNLLRGGGYRFFLQLLRELAGLRHQGNAFPGRRRDHIG